MTKFLILFSGMMIATSANAQTVPTFKPVSAEVTRLRAQNLALREEMGRLQLAVLINETLAQDDGKAARTKSNIQRVALRR